LSKKRIGLGIYEKRELREFYKVWDKTHQINDFVCSYEGETYSLIDGKRQKLDLKDHMMPFKMRHSKISS
jgi:hypothetical protein